MKYYQDNPRRISEKRFARLRDTLRRLGDLSGIVHDLNTDQVIGGNQRTRALDLLGRTPVIVTRYDTPTATGTVAEGYYEIDGERYAYRAVRWTEDQAREANIAANLGAGDWNFDALSGWNVGDLQRWGFDTELLAGWNLDAVNLKEMLNSEVEGQAPEDLWQGMPEFEQEAVEGAGSFHTISLHFPTEDGMKKFSEWAGQEVTKETKHLWYPPLKYENLQKYVAHDES